MWTSKLRLLRCLVPLVSALRGATEPGACRLPVLPISVRPTPPVARPVRNGRPEIQQLVVSWSPAYCAANGNLPEAKGECLDNRFGFVARALVPLAPSQANAHPLRCIESMPLGTTLTRRYYCIMPGVELMQDNWVNYGSCGFAHAGEYFDRIGQLWSALAYPDVEALAAGSGFLGATAFRRALLEANRLIGLKSESFWVDVRGRNVFSGFTVCYNRQFEFAACPSQPQSPAALRVIPINGP